MNNLDKNIKVHEIFPLHLNKSFDEQSANELINILYTISSKAKNKINACTGHINYNKNNPNQAQYFKNQLNEEINKWSQKVRRLGATPLSLYKVKISAHDGGFYTWDFPNSYIKYEK